MKENTRVYQEKLKSVFLFTVKQETKNKKNVKKVLTKKKRFDKLILHLTKREV